jgi:hypothetical protein
VQNTPIWMAHFLLESEVSTVHIGGYRVRAVTSYGDTALQMLESKSDLIADSALPGDLSLPFTRARRSPSSVRRI